MQANSVQRKNANKVARRVGRGGKRGKTSGKGHKGQKARAGGAGRPEERDIIKRIPKRRGYGKNRARTVNAERVRPEVVNLSDLETAFTAGERITPKLLLAKGLVRRQKGRVPTVKVLGTGTLSKKLTIVGSDVSESARKAIEAAGGTIEQ